MDRYAVFGNPIKHSKSPWIHARFAQQTRQNLEYSAKCVELADFEQEVLAFFADGGAGLNITVPFKERAWALAQTLTATARRSGAVNTLYLDSDGQLCGDNTDGSGLLRDLLQNQGATLANKCILILGAGGAVKGVMPDLIAQGAAQLCIANRTLAKAEAIAATYADSQLVATYTYQEIPERAFDLIINGTSAGLQGDVPPLPAAIVGAHTWCYDMVYGPGETAFQQWARERGAERALDGLGMLVEQAAQAFKIWRGQDPETASVIAQLRKDLGA